VGLQSIVRRRQLLRGYDIETIADLAGRTPDLLRLRDEIRKAGTDSVKQFGDTYTLEGGLSLQQNPDEFAALCAYLRETGPHRTYLEIGSASGGACRFLSDHVGFEKILSIHDGRHPRALEQQQNLGILPNCTQLVTDSHSGAATEFLHLNANDMDVVFIDGDHRYAGVMQDVRLVLRYCRPGTILILHDTVASEDVERAWLECVRSRLIVPVAEYIGDAKPLGIGVGRTR